MCRQPEPAASAGGDARTYRGSRRMARELLSGRARTVASRTLADLIEVQLTMGTKATWRCRGDCGRLPGEWDAGSARRMAVRPGGLPGAGAGKSPPGKRYAAAGASVPTARLTSA
jgi:hypothetical protein